MPHTDTEGATPKLQTLKAAGIETQTLSFRLRIRRHCCNRHRIWKKIMFIRRIIGHGILECQWEGRRVSEKRKAGILFCRYGLERVLQHEVEWLIFPEKHWVRAAVKIEEGQTSIGMHHFNSDALLIARKNGLSIRVRRCIARTSPYIFRKSKVISHWESCHITRSWAGSFF